MVKEIEFKTMNEQVVNWVETIHNGNDQEIMQVMAESSVASFMLMHNIDENLSLIRDILSKKLLEK